MEALRALVADYVNQERLDSFIKENTESLKNPVVKDVLRTLLETLSNDDQQSRLPFEIDKDQLRFLNKCTQDFFDAMTTMGVSVLHIACCNPAVRVAMITKLIDIDAKSLPMPNTLFDN